MSDVEAAFTGYVREAGRLVSRVLCRDGLALSPAWISRAAARRLRAGIAVVTAFLARLITLMALAIEPELTHRETSERRPRPRPDHSAPRPLNLFPRGRSCDPAKLSALSSRRSLSHMSGAEPAGPLLDRLARLRALAADPMPRARRYAFHLARSRPGLILAPGAGATRSGLSPVWGSEARALHDAMATAILRASRIRPPPLPPPKRARPTLTQL